MNHTVHTQKEISIAVLPFQVLGSSEALKLMALGFAEDLIVNLSKFWGLSVFSQDTTLDSGSANQPENFLKLGADFWVKGSFRKLQEKVRITIHLIKADTQKVVFADTHDEALQDIFLVQDQTIQQVVNVLQNQIDYTLLSHSYTKKETQLEAYDNWLRGIEVLRKGSREHDLEARAYFEKALEIDPTYSRAYTGLSMSYFNQWSCQLWDRWEVSQKGAQEYALKALEWDENDYLALMVLGRTYLYTGEFDPAEHCLRKSLRMNPNDAQNLMEIAFWMTFLGYTKEAEKLYLRAKSLNPLHQDTYYSYASFIYFEMGEFEKSLELSNKFSLTDMWVDFPVQVGAAHFHLGNISRALHCWDVYRAQYAEKISKTTELPSWEDAIQWQKTVNPYKETTQLEPFWAFLRSHAMGTTLPEATPVLEIVEQETPPVEALPNSFIKQGHMWALYFSGQEIFVKNSKGCQDIAKLLASPGTSFHCTELMGIAIEESEQTLALDAQAKRQYQQKIQDLQAEIQEAEDMNNWALAASRNKEYEALVAHLSQNLGLGGKSRSIGSSVEKARSAVTWRIRHTLKKWEKLNPTLYKHLSNSIKTGTLCCYEPEQEVYWEVEMD